MDLETPPYGFVQAQGVAELSEDPGEVLRTATAIGGRDMGADQADAFGSATAYRVSSSSACDRLMCQPPLTWLADRHRRNTGQQD